MEGGTSESDQLKTESRADFFEGGFSHEGDDELVAVVPTRPDGLPLLFETEAWGPVRLGKNPQFLALYISRSRKEIQYIGRISEIVDVTDSNLRENLARFMDVEEGDQVVEFSDVVKLEDPIPFTGDFDGLIRGLRYTTPEKFLKAEGTEDL